MFLDPDFLKDAKILAICVHLRVYFRVYLHGFSGRLSLKWRFGGKIGEGVVRY